MEGLMRMADINISGDVQCTLVEVSGRIDSMNANQFGDALNSTIDDGKVHIVLDLSSVDFMSSAGLRELVNAFKKAKKASGDVRLAQPSDRVREVLEMAGLDTIFRIYETRTEAVGSY
jgi:anti-sigma B factor antagonist